MSLLTRTIRISDFRRRASKVLDELTQNREPFLIIKLGVAIAVIEDIASYDEMQDTIKLLQKRIADLENKSENNIKFKEKDL